MGPKDQRAEGGLREWLIASCVLVLIGTAVWTVFGAELSLLFGSAPEASRASAGSLR